MRRERYRNSDAVRSRYVGLAENNLLMKSRVFVGTLSRETYFSTGLYFADPTQTEIER